MDRWLARPPQGDDVVALGIVGHQAAIGAASDAQGVDHPSVDAELRVDEGGGGAVCVRGREARLGGGCIAAAALRSSTSPDVAAIRRWAGR